jgi:CRISPR-associated protein Cas1
VWTGFRGRVRSKTLNRNADHPINAMLNYAYAALMTKMRIQAIADRYDPVIGILHDQRERSKELTPSFALDLMEPHRPVADRVILKLIRDETFSDADFDLLNDGVVRVGPGLVRKMVK